MVGRRRGQFHLVVLATLLVVALCEACGASHNVETADTRAPGREPPHISMSRADLPGKGDGVCRRAQVNARGKVLEVQAYCIARESLARVAFVVSAGKADKDGAYVKLQAVRPTLTTAWRPRHRVRGRCRAGGREVGCGAAIRGSMWLRTQISSGHVDACVLRVSVVTIDGTNCSPDACPGSLEIHKLFQGRPEGC